MGHVSPNLIDTLDINRLSVQSGEDGAVIAVVMLTMALRHLVFVGGKDATAEMLDGVVASVCRGDFAEPIHLAGNA